MASYNNQQSYNQQGYGNQPQGNGQYDYYDQGSGGAAPQPAEPAEEPLSPWEEMERDNGVRLTWSTWPNSRLEAKKHVIPLAAIYAPLKNRDVEWFADEQNGMFVNYDCIRCQNQRCNAIMNWTSGNKVDYHQKYWTCTLCNTRNNIPPTEPHNMMTQHEPVAELHEDSTTIEFISPADPTGEPVFVFVVDTAIEHAELESAKDTIIEVLEMLPDEAIVSLVTYGQNVAVHELGFEAMTRTVVIGGNPSKDKEPDTRKIKDLLGIRPGIDKSYVGQDSQIWQYCCQVAQVREQLTRTLDELPVDPWPQRAKERMGRATGMAAMVGVALLSAFEGYNGRMILFSGGAANVGPGKVVNTDLSTQIRSAKDIELGKAEYNESATRFYDVLATQAASQGHVVDLFSCCLDQTGLLEQRSMAEKTGGRIVLSDTFTTAIFQESLLGMFEKGAFGRLAMCFNGEIKIVTSRNIQVSGCIGPVLSLAEKSSNVSEREVGVAGTCKWSVGGLDKDTNLTFFFEVTDGQDIKDHDVGYIQFQTTFRTSHGQQVTRATTLEVMFRDPKHSDGQTHIEQGFDQEAAAVTTAKLAVHKKDTEFGVDVMRWIDQNLIRYMKKAARYRPGLPDSFQLPPNCAIYPQLMFYLRRSQFLDNFGYSPDEATFHRTLMMRESVLHCTSMIEPHLYSYSTDPNEQNYLQRVSLDEKSLRPDVALLLDSFFTVVVWYGKTAKSWLDNEELAEDPNFTWLFERLNEPVEEQKIRAGERYPHPVPINTWHEESQERFLLAKINPSQGQSRDGEQMVLTDDVSLRVFMEHLRKLVVDEN